MTIEHFAIAEIKNNWLYAQVDVEFPTKESLVGRDLYQAKIEHKQYQILETATLDSARDSFAAEDIYLVDFHRLTVMFALLYSKQWSSDEDQQMMIEFLTQIIYSEPCELYIGFQNGEPITTAILTRSSEQVLVSDITVADGSSETKMNFVKSLLTKCAITVGNGDVVLEI
ncbi:flavodoxin [Vibrio scophthalmi]|uniref:Flavodoxin n=1 Tax=Vibrio scophthalmi TaxID=45658 RepID=A0A1E3WGD9_9VIBR|nr:MULTISPECIES: hypothetical protein [Vibrio]EGU35371.1 hypothetical protein VIBRN418_00240 [Vibrio sp. N418]MCY9804436.1 flavodoxin [Vibrio scophthalmi]ODS04871.1 hypothetical protein VSF3289_04010 [Vibrio scophthalmi]